MCKTKMIIERNLPLSVKYGLISIKRGSIESGEVWVCENCNKLITNIATVKDENGKTFLVGLDCADTLTGITQTEKWQEEQYDFNQVLKFAKALKEQTASVTQDEYHIRVNYINQKGKKIYLMEWKHNIEKFYPELLKSI